MTWLMMNWKLGLLISVTVFAGIQTLRLEAETAKKELAIQDLRNYKRLAEVAATTAKENSDAAIKEINDAIPYMVEQAKSNAYKNYLAKFGGGNVACGIRADRVLHPGHPLYHGETGGAGKPDELHQPEPVLDESTIITCAIDSAYIEQWKRWAVANDLKVID
jgi:hypothetical protein